MYRVTKSFKFPSLKIVLSLGHHPQLPLNGLKCKQFEFKAPVMKRTKDKKYIFFKPCQYCHFHFPTIFRNCEIAKYCFAQSQKTKECNNIHLF